MKTVVPIGIGLANMRVITDISAKVACSCTTEEVIGVLAHVTVRLQVKAFPKV